MRMKTILVGMLMMMPGMVQTVDAASATPDALQVFKNECGACHLAYPARFLPSASWRALLGDLSNHFGEDASLDAETVATIEAYLVQNGERNTLVDEANPPLRISQRNWFVRQHSEGEVGWLKRNRHVKTMSDCMACHQ